MNISAQNPCPYLVGLKVEVHIPLSDSKTFRDWAIINEIDEDLLSLQLSRDILPSGVSLRVGQILTIRGEVDFQIFVCRALIVSKSIDQDLLLRLTGEIVSDELREFFRIDAFLPIKFHRLGEQNPDRVNKLWEERRRQRQEEDRAREQRRLEARREENRARELGLLDSSLSGTPAVLSQDKGEDGAEDNEYYDSWNNVTSVAVNISGGGVKISTDQKFLTTKLLLLEIFVPSSRRIVDVVAQVIFSSQDDQAGERRNSFHTGLRFVFIDESARSAISSHISSIQLQRIRQFKGFADVEPLEVDSRTIAERHYTHPDNLEAGEETDIPERLKGRKRIGQLGLALFFSLIVWLLCSYFSGYMVSHPKNAIQNMFEAGIRKLKGRR